jgi:hypothetical protein
MQEVSTVIEKWLTLLNTLKSSDVGARNEFPHKSLETSKYRKYIFIRKYLLEYNNISSVSCMQKKYS